MIANKCSQYATCEDLCDVDGDRNYACRCKPGYRGNGVNCELAINEETCDSTMLSQMKNKLRPLPISDVFKPKLLTGHNSVIIELQTPMRKFLLGSKKYTGFIEFNRQTCGAKFIRGLTQGGVNVDIFDTYNKDLGMDRVYDVQGTKGVYFKKAYGESSMAVIQYTKKIASLKDYAVDQGLSVDQNALEVGQVFKKGRYAPLRDILYVSISGDMVNDSPAGMADAFTECFNPNNIMLSLWNDRIDNGDEDKFNDDYNILNGDATKCYVMNKFSKIVASGKLKCTEGDFTSIVAGEMSYCTMKNPKD